jgi:hypothetical protein
MHLTCVCPPWANHTRCHVVPSGCGLAPNSNMSHKRAPTGGCCCPPPCTKHAQQHSECGSPGSYSRTARGVAPATPTSTRRPRLLAAVLWLLVPPPESISAFQLSTNHARHSALAAAWPPLITPNAGNGRQEGETAKPVAGWAGRLPGATAAGRCPSCRIT